MAIAIASAGALLGGSAGAQVILQDGSLTAIAKNDGPTSVTNTFTVTAGAGVLVVETYVQNNVGSDVPPTLSTWGSQNFSYIGGEFNARSTYASSDIFYIVNPAPGTHDIVVTDTSGGTVTAMAMQAYTLNGVDTNTAPVFVGANQAFGTSKSVVLSGVPAGGAWAAFSFSWGFNGDGNTVTSTGGTPIYGQVLNNLPGFIGQAVLMGGVGNLPAGSTTVTVANPNGGGVQSALAAAVFASAGANTNIITPQFVGLASSSSVAYGTSSLALSGQVGTNGNYLPAGTVITVAINGNSQSTTVNDSTGDFSINYNTIGIPPSLTPYPIAYTSTAATRFLAATNTGTTITISPLPVVLSGFQLYNGTATVSAANLTVANLVNSDNLMLAGSVSVAATNAGPETITSFAGLSLSGPAAANYTLTGASGAVTIVAPGGAKTPGLTNWIGIFNQASDISGWTAMGGSVACSLSFLAGDAPPWGPSSGALVMQAPVPTGGMYAYFGRSVGNTNLAGYSQLEFDVKVGTNQSVWSIYSTACNNLIPTIENPGMVYSSSQPAVYPVAAYNGWQHMVFPASDFSSLASVQKILFEMVSGPFPAATTMDLEFANIKWVKPPTAVNPTITVNSSDVVRTADSRWLSINVGAYDQDFNLQHTVPEAQAAGWTMFRYPGGSVADNFHWASSITSGQNNTFSNFCKVMGGIGGQAMITVNYGTGTPEEAAAWVAYANITNHLGIKYWEVGNEIYAWPTETDTNSPGHDPYLYGSRAATYIQQMKAKDPTIKVGVVVVPGLQIDPGTNVLHYATNLVTGQGVTGWTPVVLSQLRQAGVIPDFIIYHNYPENGAESDQTLLATANWADDAAEFRGEINDFLGPAGTNVELLVTENNSEAGNPGKQSVSLVNALYYADSLGQIMQTEINSRVWWQFHDGNPPYTDGNLSSSLYGWRIYGAFGVADHTGGLQITNRYPPFFAAELLSRLVGGGDAVVSAASDVPLVSSYAAVRTNGNLTLMLINKSPTNFYAANILLTNCVPGATATIYSYGMPQDNAARAGNNTCDITTNTFSVSPNFNYPLPPYSINVLAFTLQTPAPVLAVLPQPSGSQFAFQLLGQTNVSYVLQNSTDLLTWTATSTNILTDGVLNVTSTISPGPSQQFWRAVWMP
ncbi:MAG TPA: YDG domain-containing protein [Verrucomicrobiae bacterium]|nr:YDG domain-containing protein [Verrucomicrobiae bacterium]